MALAAWWMFWPRDANSVSPVTRNSTRGPPCSNPPRLWLLPQVISAPSFSIEIEKSEQTVMNLRPVLPQRAALAVLASLFLSGCRGAPSINVLGSFFPGWMLCMGLGLLGALGFRQVFIKTNVEAHLVPRPLVYLCLWGLVTLTSWLLCFRN